MTDVDLDSLRAVLELHNTAGMEFPDDLREHLRSEGSIYAEIREQKELSDELQEKLRAELQKVTDRFAPSVTTES